MAMEYLLEHYMERSLDIPSDIPGTKLTSDGRGVSADSMPNEKLVAHAMECSMECSMNVRPQYCAARDSGGLEGDDPDAI